MPRERRRLRQAQLVHLTRDDARSLQQLRLRGRTREAIQHPAVSAVVAAERRDDSASSQRVPGDSGGADRLTKRVIARSSGSNRCLRGHQRNAQLPRESRGDRRLAAAGRPDDGDAGVHLRHRRRLRNVLHRVREELRPLLLARAVVHVVAVGAGEAVDRLRQPHHVVRKADRAVGAKLPDAGLAGREQRPGR